MQVKYNELTEPYVSFEKWISSLDNLEEVINSADLLKEHTFYLNEIVNKSKYLLSEDQEYLTLEGKKISTSGNWAI